VVLIDHVTKDAESRGRYALGGQAKMNALDGAAYTVEVAEHLGQGLRGVIVLRIAKDRPGSIRPHCGPFRKLDRTQEAARIIVDSTSGDRIVVTVEQPTTRIDAVGVAKFRPTRLMERVSRYLADNPEGASKKTIIRDVTGNLQALRSACDCLVEEGFASLVGTTHKHEKLFIEVENSVSTLGSSGWSEGGPGVVRDHGQKADGVVRDHPSPLRGGDQGPRQPVGGSAGSFQEGSSRPEEASKDVPLAASSRVANEDFGRLMRECIVAGGSPTWIGDQLIDRSTGEVLAERNGS
jgi:hypothetical protein